MEGVIAERYAPRRNGSRSGESVGKLARMVNSAKDLPERYASTPCRRATARTLDAYHCAPPCAVGTSSAFRPSAILA